ncbi:MAG: phosphate/phosphite/phosphonate ABC transporter substrate-binding protein [Tenericutes bacterium]|jgi:phosphonate transport system substrate-binding protein|nr:phosphate/phosphite/phosphonate ABC transporter substrate-binding protein [Mycoplasmatota bacterium]
MKKVLGIFVLAFMVFGFAACSGEEGYVNPEILEVQLIPSRDAVVLNAKRAPLEALLEAELDMQVNVTIATDYNALIEGMASEQIHVGLLATTAYVLAHDEGAANVILKSLRYSVDDNGNELTDEPLVSGYKSQLVVGENSGIESLQDLVGKRIAISSFTSTSGFVWPANLLADNDIDPENDVTWVNAGGHDNAILAIINGDADAAFTFKDARTLLVDDYPDINDRVIFLQDTTLIPNDTISVIPNLDPDLVVRIKQAFINIAADPEGSQIIDDIYSHKGYAEATDAEYDIVRTYLERQEDWDF